MVGCELHDVNSSNPSSPIAHKQHPEHLPPPIIRYVFLNRTPKTWKKLIQTCKYFYSKYPFYPVEKLYVGYDKKWYADDHVINLKRIAISISTLWLYDKFLDMNYYNFPTEFLSSKIFKCDLKTLWLTKQYLTWNEYQFLTSSASFELLYLCQNIIKFSDGAAVTLDKLLENIQSVEKLEISCPKDFPIVIEDTAKKVLDHLSRLKMLQRFGLYTLPVTFDASIFKNFVLNNRTIDIGFSYDPFGAALPDAYKTNLHNLIEKIVDKPPVKIPYFDFPGIYGSVHYKIYIKLYLANQ